MMEGRGGERGGLGRGREDSLGWGLGGRLNGVHSVSVQLPSTLEEEGK